MLEKFHGQYYYNLYYVSQSRSLYANKLVSGCNVVMAEFDAYYAKLIPALVQHFSCCSKCRVSYCYPRYMFGGYLRWRVCYPTSQSYCYYYTQFW